MPSILNFISMAASKDISKYRHEYTGTTKQFLLVTDSGYFSQHRQQTYNHVLPSSVKIYR